MNQFTEYRVRKLLTKLDELKRRKPHLCGESANEFLATDVQAMIDVSNNVKQSHRLTLSNNRYQPDLFQ